MTADWYPGLRPNTPFSGRWRSFLDDLTSQGVTVDPGQSGGFANRNIRGTSTPSLHASDRAYDVNWMSNPEGSRQDEADIARQHLERDMGGSTAPITQIHPMIARETAARHGARWGGDFRGRSPDPMHFEFPGTAPMGPGRSLVAQAGLTPPAASSWFPSAHAETPASGGSQQMQLNPWRFPPFGAGAQGEGFEAMTPQQQPAQSLLGSLDWMLPEEQRGAGRIPNADAMLPPAQRGPQPSAPMGVPNPMMGSTPGGDWDFAMQPSQQADPTSPPISPEMQALIAANPDSGFQAPTRPQQAAAPAAPATPQGPSFGNALYDWAHNPLLHMAIELLKPSGGNPAQAAAMASQAQRQQSEYQRSQRQRSVMDRIWSEAFPNGQPNMQHPLLAGQSPEIATMIAGLGAEAAIPMLARSAMDRKQFGFQVAGDQLYVTDPRQGTARPAVPGQQPRAPEAIRTNALRADSAYRSISTLLDQYQRVVQSAGITAVPGPESDAVKQLATQIKLQLKELNNLGVLNGPDLDLMNQLLTDTSPSPGNMLSNPAGRVGPSVQRLKQMLKVIRDNAMAAAGQQPQQDQQQNPRLRYDPSTGELTNAN